MKQISRQIFEHIVNGGPEGEVSVIRQISAKNNRPELAIYKVASGVIKLRVAWEFHIPRFYITITNISQLDHGDLQCFIEEREAEEVWVNMLKIYNEKHAMWMKQQATFERLGERI